ncbi:MAG: prepilin peptidase [Bacilli bacterium]
MFFQIFIPILIFIFGLVLGSFTTCYSYRMINNISIFKVKRSFCPKCKHELKWYDNIPLFSYVFLGGRCRYCHEKISIRYPLIEFSMSILFLLIYFEYFYFLNNFNYIFSVQNLLYVIAFCLAIFALINVLLIDKEIMTIPLSLDIVLGFGAVLYYVTKCIYEKNFVLTNFLTFVVVLLVFLSIFFIGEFVVHKELIGLGDVIIISILALIFGIFGSLLFILLSSLSASIIEGIKASKLKERKEFPFGPYIAVSGIIILFVFDIINTSLISFFII